MTRPSFDSIHKLEARVMQAMDKKSQELVEAIEAKHADVLIKLTQKV